MTRRSNGRFVPIGVAINPEALRRARIEAGLSRAKLAYEIGMTRQGLWLIERGVNRPMPEHLHAIARRLGVTVDKLIHPEFNPEDAGLLLRALVDALGAEDLCPTCHCTFPQDDEPHARGCSYARARAFLTEGARPS
jgi:transcriptional regulator with XRE-family HTH domain